MRSLEDLIVVITGASSGIGRASAHAFARSNATVVVTARREEKLEEVVEECHDLGGECVAIPCDMTSEQDVEALADQVVESFGAIDVWVNNAAVTGFGRIDEMPEELYQQIIETNLMGYVNGTRAAVTRFRKQGEGVLINVASVAGKIGQPYTSAYCTSKFGIVGLSNSVRAELLDEPNIHVCTVLPPSIDTPLFQHGANYAGRQAKPMPPVYSADRVARAILSLAVRPKREVAIGAMGKFLNTFSRVTPALAERVLARQVSKKHVSDQPASEELGNVIEPTADPYGVSGGWTNQQESRSYGSRALLGVGVALVAAFGAYMLAQKSRPEVEEEPRAEGEEYELLSPEQVPEGAYAPL